MLLNFYHLLFSINIPFHVNQLKKWWCLWYSTRCKDYCIIYFKNFKKRVTNTSHDFLLLLKQITTNLVVKNNIHLLPMSFALWQFYRSEIWIESYWPGIKIVYSFLETLREKSLPPSFNFYCYKSFLDSPFLHLQNY